MASVDGSQATVNVVVELPASARLLTGGGGLRSGSGDALLADEVAFVGVRTLEIAGEPEVAVVALGEGASELDAPDVDAEGLPGVVVGQK